MAGLAGTQQHAHERLPETLGFTCTNRSYGGNVTTIDSNRRMRENRMSGGVGGVTGAIPLPRPDPRPFSATEFFEEAEHGLPLLSVERD